MANAPEAIASPHSTHAGVGGQPGGFVDDYKAKGTVQGRHRTEVEVVSSDCCI